MGLLEVQVEAGGIVEFINSMKHKKRWPKSRTNAFSAKFGPKNNLTEDSCLMCFAVLEDEGLEEKDKFTQAFSDGCPDYYDQQIRMHNSTITWGRMDAGWSF